MRRLLEDPEEQVPERRLPVVGAVVDDVPRPRAVAGDEPAVELVAPHLVVGDREERDGDVRDKDERGKEAVVPARDHGARVNQRSRSSNRGFSQKDREDQEGERWQTPSSPS